MPADAKGTDEFDIGGRHFVLNFAPLDKHGLNQASGSEKRSVQDPKAQVAGIHHRPLMPLMVSISERATTTDARASRRELMLAQPSKVNPARENAISTVVSKQDFGDIQWQIDLKEFTSGKPTVLSIGSLTEAELKEVAKKLNPDRNVSRTNEVPVPKNLVGVTFMEAPISISDIVYVPNLNQIDTFFLPKTIFAPQSYELNFAGGSIYDVKVRRKSEVLAFANGVSDFAGSFVRIPASLFTFTVVHEEKSGGGAFGSDSVGGSKDPGDYRKKQDKDPGDYRRKVDKD